MTFLGSILQGHTDVIIVLDPGEGRLCFGIVEEAVVIAFDQDDLTIKAFNETCSIIVSRFPNHVPKDINQVAFSDLVIPSADQLRIHFLYGFKRAVIRGKDIFMSEMQITREEYLTHLFPFFLNRL